MLRLISRYGKEKVYNGIPGSKCSQRISRTPQRLKGDVSVVCRWNIPPSISPVTSKVSRSTCVFDRRYSSKLTLDEFILRLYWLLVLVFSEQASGYIRSTNNTSSALFYSPKNKIKHGHPPNIPCSSSHFTSTVTWVTSSPCGWIFNRTISEHSSTSNVAQ